MPPVSPDPHFVMLFTFQSTVSCSLTIPPRYSVFTALPTPFTVFSQLCTLVSRSCCSVYSLSPLVRIFFVLLARLHFFFPHRLLDLVEISRTLWRARRAIHYFLSQSLFVRIVSAGCLPFLSSFLPFGFFFSFSWSPPFSSLLSFSFLPPFAVTSFSSFLVFWIVVPRFGGPHSAFVCLSLCSLAVPSVRLIVWTLFHFDVVTLVYLIFQVRIF